MALYKLGRPADIGELFGSGLGSGLGKVMEASDTQRGLEAIGYKPDIAKKLSFLHPNILQKEIQNRFSTQNREGLSAPALTELIPGLSQQASERIARATPGIQLEFYRNYLKSGLPSEFADALGSEDTAQNRGALQNFTGQQPQNGQPSQEDGLRMVHEYLQNPLGLNNNQFNVGSAPQPQTNAQNTREVLSQATQKPEKSFAQRVQEAKVKKEEAALARQERKEAFKETKETRKDLIASKREAETVLQDLDRLEELEKEGKLDTAGYAEFLKRGGLDIPALMSEGSQEFEKIRASFLKGAKEAFGGRVSNFEVESFMKSIPGLSQSPEGRKRVFANLKRFKRGQIARYNAYRDVLKRNGNVPPLDLEEQIEDESAKHTNSIARKFREDLAKPVPKGQNRFITALMAQAGNILGAPGAILKAVSGTGGQAAAGSAISSILV